MMPVEEEVRSLGALTCCGKSTETACWSVSSRFVEDLERDVECAAYGTRWRLFSRWRAAGHLAEGRPGLIGGILAIAPGVICTISFELTATASSSVTPAVSASV